MRAVASGCTTLSKRPGRKIELLPPSHGLPDLVFTANAALIYRDRAVLSRFRHPERQGEEPYDDAWLAGARLRKVEQLPDGLHFEGAGDALFCGDTLFAGYRIRSDARGHQQIGDMLGCRVIPVELVDRYYYHLDTCFCPLAPGEAIYYPPAFDDYGRAALQSHVPELIEVERRRSPLVRLQCGGRRQRTVVTNTGCPQLHDALRRAASNRTETPLDEFVKAGGSEVPDAAARRRRSGGVEVRDVKIAFIE